MPERAWWRRPAGPQGDARLPGLERGCRATHDDTIIISAKISWGRPFGGHSWRPAGQLGCGPCANFRTVPARAPTQRQRRQRLQRGTCTHARPLPHLTVHGWGHAACKHPRPRQDASPTSRTVPPCTGALPCTHFPADTAPFPPSLRPSDDFTLLAPPPWPPHNTSDPRTDLLQTRPSRQPTMLVATAVVEVTTVEMDVAAFFGRVAVGSLLLGAPRGPRWPRGSLGVGRWPSGCVFCPLVSAHECAQHTRRCAACTCRRRRRQRPGRPPVFDASVDAGWLWAGGGCGCRR